MPTYKIYLGESKCTTCGKKHKKIFEIDGKPYGSSCAKEVLGKELNAPIWLYNLADEYIQEYGIEDAKTSDIDSFEVNFWNTLPVNNGTMLGKLYRGGMFESYVYNKTVKINGKSVKVDWQHEIVEYIRNRYAEIKESL